MDPVKELVESHKKTFPGAVSTRVFSCPGRINLIGEHIDYNGGHVLPASIDKAIYLCITKNNDRLFRFHSTAFSGVVDVPLDTLFTQELHHGDWWIYTAGVVRLMFEKGWPADHGFDLTFLSTIPVGSGMSSSAAMCEVCIYAFMQEFGIAMTKQEMVLLGQRIEREAAGVKCGIMDQFAVVHGKKDHAVLLDTRDMSYSYVPVDSHKAHWILVNSGVKHSLRESGYNDRRHQCENALAIMKSKGIKGEHLCDISMNDFERVKQDLPEAERKRAFHAISENIRTLEFDACMKKNDYAAAGRLLYGSHESLRDNFEVSISEIDQMVEWARGIKGVIGARLMGGGFGGCTINMVEVGCTEEFKKIMTAQFEKAFGRTPEIYECVVEDGVKEEKI